MNSNSKIIKDFLNQVKLKLPEWLKWREKELEIILEDLKEQILINAKYISVIEEPDEIAIRKAINQLGTPQSIAQNYKNRGTPKFFISEELFDIYLRILAILVVIVVAINFLIGIFQIFRKLWWELLTGIISGSYIGVMIVVIIVTTMFVYLSMEGFLPEDFEVLPKYLGGMIKQEQVQPVSKPQTTKEIKIEQEQLQARKKLAETRKKTQVKLEEARQEWTTAKMKSKKKYYEVKVGDLIGGTIFGIIFGLFFILQPFIAIYSDFDTQFLDWLRIFGLLIFISGLMNLIRLAFGTSNITAQQIMMIMSLFISIANIPLFMWLFDHPETFPILLLSGFLISTLSGTSLLIYRIIIIFIILGTVIGVIVDLVKIVKISSLK